MAFTKIEFVNSKIIIFVRIIFFARLLFNLNFYKPYNILILSVKQYFLSDFLRFQLRPNSDKYVVKVEDGCLGIENSIMNYQELNNELFNSQNENLVNIFQLNSYVFNQDQILTSML
eukprot:TRINITY_DN14484_c0_g2_i3.p2 TRINITY_DN14484_c0_g2~~TRINITY_DN14484_c0_g2_i3.p2  ORF type:complete len:117 (+),score=0.05 TRINITY_DN14484_c0_g2_i3:451-801(+)